MPPENPDHLDHRCDLIAALLGASSFTTVLTGAGISTESGIPDFRSPSGKWATASPILFSDFLSDPAARSAYWHQKCDGHDQMVNAKPNAAHQVLARWEQAGCIGALVTQNIDGLHRKAGNKSIVEIHGNVMQVACTSGCGFRAESLPYVDAFLANEAVPQCPQCAGYLKHATISFGQSLNQADIEQAVAWAERSDLFFALGSSLVVTPAAELPHLAQARGARLVIINRDPTPLDELADVVVYAELGATLTAIDACRRARS